MFKKKKVYDYKISILLIIAGVLIGSGVGQIVQQTTDLNVIGGYSTVGLGVGFVAAFLYEVLKKK